MARPEGSTSFLIESLETYPDDQPTTPTTKPRAAAGPRPRPGGGGAALPPPPATPKAPPVGSVKDGFTKLH